jgi:hypothetical protein
MLSSRSICRYIFTAAAILFTILLFGAQLRSSGLWTTRLIPGLPNINSGSVATLPCLDLLGANETLVVLKTGAGEIEEKLPIHLQTTFRCYPGTVVFSDFGETFMNHTIVDVLEASYHQNSVGFPAKLQVPVANQKSQAGLSTNTSSFR